MDKELLTLYVSHEIGEKVMVTSYEKEWSPADYEYFMSIHYQIPIQNRPYMTDTYFTGYSAYKQWEREYLRRFKLNKIINKIKDGIQI